jgi:multidrug efflux pump subunit AcrB
MFVIGLSLLGYVSYTKLPVELIPNATLPALIVQVLTPLEVDPSYIESQAIIPIEVQSELLKCRRSNQIFLYSMEL